MGPHLLKYIDAISEWAGRIVYWLVYALVLVVVVDIIMRYFIREPLFWGYDAAYMIYGIIVMLCGSYALLHNVHIRVDVIYNSLSARTTGVIMFLFYVCLFLPFTLCMIWAGTQQTLEAIKFNEVAITTPWHHVTYPYKAIIPLSFLLLSIQGVAEFLRSLRLIIKKEG